MTDKPQNYHRRDRQASESSQTVTDKVPGVTDCDRQVLEAALNVAHFLYRISEYMSLILYDSILDVCYATFSG